MALFDFLKSPDRHREPPRRNGRANGAPDRPRREHGRAEQPPRQPPRPEETRRDYGDEDEEAPRERHASRTQDERRETRRQNHEAETLPPPPRMHQEEKRQRVERQEAGPQEQEDRRPRRKPRMPGSRAVVFAREHLMDLLGREPEAVSGLSLGPNGWKVRLEAVEMPRVPSSTDVMATYEVELDEEGELIGYHRVSRYFRNQTDSEE
jgi:hypothetical protein